VQKAYMLAIQKKKKTAHKDNPLMSA